VKAETDENVENSKAGSAENGLGVRKYQSKLKCSASKWHHQWPK
jgi:hypothetical protein